MQCVYVLLDILRGLRILTTSAALVCSVQTIACLARVYALRTASQFSSTRRTPPLSRLHPDVLFQARRPQSRRPKPFRRRLPLPLYYSGRIYCDLTALKRHGWVSCDLDPGVVYSLARVQVPIGVSCLR